jgi:hypothetical protein
MRILINATEFSFKVYSLGLLYIGAALEKAGHDVSLHDERCKHINENAGD